MPAISELRKDIAEYLKKHGLLKKWYKAKSLFESNPHHPSLNTELLEPHQRGIYSFRLDKRYRALFLCLSENDVEIIAITKHYRK
jgi:Txe/YoeB family toxin of Txe-Axe toxin-antitoxin module